jgi:hypothetical protein
MNWQQVQPFLVALAIGLLLGFERERSHSRRLSAGSRSFALLSLLGAVAAEFGQWVVLAGLVGVAALMALAYFRTNDEDPGTTTEIAALVTYLLGALAHTRPAVAVALAVLVAGLLLSKDRIHRFARDIVSEVELEDAIKFFVVAFVILPLLPDRPLGPYGVLNPSKVWLLVVLLTGIGWVGYIGVRALGPQRGLLVTGLAGGFVSATATTASMGRIGRTAADPRWPARWRPAWPPSCNYWSSSPMWTPRCCAACGHRWWWGPPRSWSSRPSSTGELDPIRTRRRFRFRRGGRSRFVRR